MLRIGEIARLGGVSVKTLRHYDETGLLVPADVDDASGYRRYTPMQLAQLRRIVTLKELGLSLAEIAMALQDAASLPSILRAKRVELRRSQTLTRARIRRIDRILDGAAPLDVVTRRTDSSIVAAFHGFLDSYAELDELAAEARDLLPRGTQIVGRGAQYHQCETGDRIECDALLFLREMPVKTPRGLRIEVWEPQPVASAIYAGDAWSNAFGSLYQWMALTGHTIAGPKREDFFTDETTEVLIPIQRGGEA